MNDHHKPVIDNDDFFIIPQKKTRFRSQRIRPLHKERVDQSAFDCKVPAHNMTLWMNKYICEAKKNHGGLKQWLYILVQHCWMVLDPFKFK